MKKEGPRNLYVGSLHYNITEPMLKKIFEPFGYVEKLNIQRDENGLSKGYGFIEVWCVCCSLTGHPSGRNEGPVNCPYRPSCSCDHTHSMSYTCIVCSKFWRRE